MKLAYIAMAAVAMALTGCAATQEDCASVDWRSLGVKDGASGQPRSSSTNHFISGCPKHGVVFDDVAYNDGLREGYKTYCVSDVQSKGAARARAEKLYNGPEVLQSCQGYGANFNEGAYRLGYEQELRGLCDRDWNELGRADAMAGKQPRNVDATRRLCAQMDMGFYVDSYSRSYNDAKTRFCSVAYARELGSRGQPKPNWGICGGVESLELGSAYGDLRYDDNASGAAVPGADPNTWGSEPPVGATDEFGRSLTPACQGYDPSVTPDWCYPGAPTPPVGG